MLSLVLALGTIGLEVGVPCAHVVLSRCVPRRCRGLLSHNSHSASLVPRAGVPPKPTINDAQSMGMDWEPPSLPGPSNGPASPSRKRKTHASAFAHGKDKRPMIPGKEPEQVDSFHFPDVPLDPNRRNVPHPLRYASIHSIISPDPTKSNGLKDPLTGERSYYRSITDDHDAVAALNTLTKHSGAVNPSYLVATSRNQLGPLLGLGAAKWQEIRYTGDRELSKEPVWLRVTPHALGEESWTDAQLRQNLVHQHRHFHNHDSGQSDSEWAKISRDMSVKCKTQNCTVERPEGWIMGSQEEEPLPPKKRWALVRRSSN